MNIRRNIIALVAAGLLAVGLLGCAQLSPEPEVSYQECTDWQLGLIINWPRSVGHLTLGEAIEKGKDEVKAGVTEDGTPITDRDIRNLERTERKAKACDLLDWYPGPGPEPTQVPTPTREPTPTPAEPTPTPTREPTPTPAEPTPTPTVVVVTVPGGPPWCIRNIVPFVRPDGLRGVNVEQEHTETGKKSTLFLPVDPNNSRARLHIPESRYCLQGQ